MLAKKLEAAVAGQATGAATYVEDVFSTYLYTGNGSSQVIENGIRLGDSYGSGSAYFDGSGDYLQSTISALSGQFTIEFWVYRPSSGNNFFFTIGDSSTSTGAEIYIGSSGGQLNYYSNNAVRINGGTPPSAGAWAYIALTRDSSNDVRMYVNGSQVGSSYNQSSTINTTLRIGVEYYSGSISGYLTGYLSNFRISNTVRTVTTVPTTEFSNDGNTVFLALQGDTPFTDNSTNGFTITQNGNVAAKSFGPFTSDVAGEGGLVWIKDRNDTYYHRLASVPGPTLPNYLASNATDAASSGNGIISSFNADGFTVNVNGGSGGTNTTNIKYASWTFRKAPKFFDVQQVTLGTSSNRQVTHNLGATPGCIIGKKTNGTSNWVVYHKDIGINGWLGLQTTNATTTRTGTWGTSSPTDSSFYFDETYFGNSGDTYIFYIFAHDAGGFGDAGDQSVIKCGSFASTNVEADITLGWEPQFIIWKNATNANNWFIFDTMRGLIVDGGSGTGDKALYANLTNAEAGTYGIDPTPTGFRISAGWGSHTYIYIAIRRGPMKTPTDGTTVFNPSLYTGNGSNTTILVDNGVLNDATYFHGRSSALVPRIYDRLRGAQKELRTSSTAAEGTDSDVSYYDTNSGFYTNITGSSNSNFNNSGATSVNYGFTRAPGFFDVVCYTGNATARNINHNLGVEPELIIAKSRSNAEGWYVYAKSLGINNYLVLNTTANPATNTDIWGTLSDSNTSTTFHVGNDVATNGSGYTYVAYLFGSVPGVSKVGSYTGNGTSQTLDCGFSNGARFVLIKATSGSPIGWVLFDASRGIVSGNDPYIFVNTSGTEVTSNDSVDPSSGGFIVNQNATTNLNENTETYIYLAIA